MTSCIEMRIMHLIRYVFQKSVGRAMLDPSWHISREGTVIFYETETHLPISPLPEENLS